MGAVRALVYEVRCGRKTTSRRRVVGSEWVVVKISVSKLLECLAVVFDRRLTGDKGFILSVECCPLSLFSSCLWGSSSFLFVGSYLSVGLLLYVRLPVAVRV